MALCYDDKSVSLNTAQTPQETEVPPRLGRYEIVERLADHIGIIDHGKLVAQGSLDELRRANTAGSTLEEIFIHVVGGDEAEKPTLEWLK